MKLQSKQPVKQAALPRFQVDTLEVINVGSTALLCTCSHSVQCLVRSDHFVCVCGQFDCQRA